MSSLNKIIWCLADIIHLFKPNQSDRQKAVLQVKLWNIDTNIQENFKLKRKPSESKNTTRPVLTVKCRSLFHKFWLTWHCAKSYYSYGGAQEIFDLQRHIRQWRDQSCCLPRGAGRLCDVLGLGGLLGHQALQASPEHPAGQEDHPVGEGPAEDADFQPA